MMGTNIQLIAKLPPVDTLEWVALCLEECPGVMLHCCNTLPHPEGRGGISGQFSLVHSIVREVYRCEPTAKIIAGGGVRSRSEIQAYFEAGASHVAMGSASSGRGSAGSDGYKV